MVPARARASDIHRRPTPTPGFDVAKFARDSEQKMSAAETVDSAEDKTPTGPPPPYHPASMPPQPKPGAQLRECASIPAPLEARLRECGARITRVRSELAVGAFSREEAASVLRIELQSLAASARGAKAAVLAGWLGDLGAAIEQLGGIEAFLHVEPLYVFVADPDVEVRERIVLAFESLGHVARSAANLRDVASEARPLVPNVVVIAAVLAGERPDATFSNVVRELTHAEQAEVVVYSTAPLAQPPETGAEQRETPRRVSLSSTTVDALIAQLGPILDELGW
jgi:predicted metal-binding protein